MCVPCMSSKSVQTQLEKIDCTSKRLHPLPGLTPLIEMSSGGVALGLPPCRLNKKIVDKSVHVGEVLAHMLDQIILYQVQ